MINFEYIKRFFIGDSRFSYMHDICKNEIVVGLSNGQKFTIIQENYNLFKAVYIVFNIIANTRVSFNISDEDSFKKSIETIYKLATVYDEQSEKTKTYEEDKMAEMNRILAHHNSITDFGYLPKEVEPGVSATDIELALDAHNYVVAKYEAIEGDPSFNAAYGSDVNIFIYRNKDKNKWVFQCKYLDEGKIYEEDNIEEINSILQDYVSLSDYNKQSKEAVEYPKGGSTMPNQTVNKSFDFLNDYKVVKLAERAINDNFAELAELFFNYSNSEEELETILLCGNSKVLFFAHGSNRKITIEFGQDGEEPFRYVHTNNGINILNDYDPKALNTIGNLIESAVDAWLEDDENRMNSIGLNDHILSLVDNIKTMINLINTTIGKYNA